MSIPRPAVRPLVVIDDHEEIIMSDTMAHYQRAQDGFDEVLATVGAGEWDRPSMCTEWTIRDVIGHVVWGQRLAHGWAVGREYTETGGAPGAPHPGSDELAGAQPLEAWRAASAATMPALTPESLSRLIVTSGFGEIPLEGFVTLLVTDLLAHTADIAYALGHDVRLAPEAIPFAFAWSREQTFRVPGGVGPELTPPTGADEQTRFLAYLGRKAW
jgi:uncharacterized protein (TIGR03086 family)